MEKELLKFINEAHTTYQAVNLVKKILLENNFIELDFINERKIEKGKNYFIIKNDSSIIAFKVGKTLSNPSFNIVASHNDSPMLKIKPNGIIYQNGYTKLNTEIYGGPIYTTWMDRPLGISGRVVIKENNKIISKPISFKKTVIIPNLAIHLNREINSGFSLNPQIDMQAILSLEQSNINTLIKKELGEVEVLDYDLFLYNKEEGCLAGANDELIISPRLDDLECYYTSLIAFTNSSNDDNINIWVGFNHEEVGSRSNNAAGSTFLVDIIDEILTKLNLEKQKLDILNRSLIISADNAHALHPNHPEKTDPTNSVKLNEGIVIKYNANLSYTTDAISSGIFKSICESVNVPYQVYTNRSDVRGGSTLGSILLGSLSINSVDIGLAQLAMHSTYETAGVKDISYLKDALKAFYSKHIEYFKPNEIMIK